MFRHFPVPYSHKLYTQVKALDFNQPGKVWKMNIPKWLSRWRQLKKVFIFLKCVWSIFWAVALKLLVRFSFWQQNVSGQWNFPQVVIFKFCFISYCSLTSLRNLLFIHCNFMEPLLHTALQLNKLTNLKFNKTFMFKN